jgi:isopentenyldiphosphate isomerase
VSDAGSHLDDELLDAMSPTGEPLGRLPRSVVHAEGLWHGVFHCLVVRSGSPSRVLLQRRRHGARSFPALLDLTVTGHLAAGERPIDGVRELEEELGLAIDPARLVALGHRLVADDAGEGRNREIAHVFLLEDDTPLAELRVDPREVAGFVELAAADLLRIMVDTGAKVPAAEVDVTGAVRQVVVSAAELIPPVDSYWIVLMTMAQRYAAGIGPLGI